MNRSLSIATGFVALVFALTSANDAQAQCKNRLINKSFSCIFKSDSPSSRTGETCFEFLNSDEPGSPKFDLDDTGNASSQGFVQYSCTCDPSGNFNSPRFNRSQGSFSCSGSEIAFIGDLILNFPWGMRGQMSQNGRIITAHQVDILAGSYVLQCNRVASCGDRLASIQKSQSGNTVKLQSYLEKFSALQEMRR